ncbi:AbiH family protein [Labilibaculum euxinus]
MKNIVIIGNGFDLAHGLKTKYSDFIHDMITNPQKYNFDRISDINNKILEVLLNCQKDLWSDIECIYFDILTNLHNSSYMRKTYNIASDYTNVVELNQDFNEIKKWLCQYLKEEEAKFIFTENYDLFFDNLNKKDSVILNFNYTKTVREYIKNRNLDIDLIHIHGELSNSKNPIIFGFAAGNDESKELLNKNDNNYVRNIKKFNYLYTNNEEKLKAHLEESQEFNVYVLGHSCGISDKLILSQVFNSKGIYKIYPFYFKDIDGYFETMVNIDRIIDDYSKSDKGKVSFNKLVSLPNSYEMPQIETDDKLITYLKKILEEKRPHELAEESIVNGLSKNYY